MQIAQGLREGFISHRSWDSAGSGYERVLQIMVLALRQGKACCFSVNRLKVKDPNPCKGYEGCYCHQCKLLGKALGNTTWSTSCKSRLLLEAEPFVPSSSCSPSCLGVMMQSFPTLPSFPTTEMNGVSSCFTIRTEEVLNRINPCKKEPRPRLFHEHRHQL